jgi:hypothetical protein
MGAFPALNEKGGINYGDKHSYSGTASKDGRVLARR